MSPGLTIPENSRPFRPKYWTEADPAHPHHKLDNALRFSVLTASPPGPRRQNESGPGLAGDGGVRLPVCQKWGDGTVGAGALTQAILTCRRFTQPGSKNLSHLQQVERPRTRGCLPSMASERSPSHLYCLGMSAERT